MSSSISSQELGFIHNFLPGKPGGPTLLLLHGTGGDENDLIGLGRMLAPDAAILSPRGKVLEGNMPRFFRRLAQGVFDLEDVRRRANELAEFVGAAADRYGFDRARVTAVGYSNGANIAAAMLLLRPTALAGAVLLHAMVPIVPEQLPDLSAVSVFLSGGKTDTMISPRDTEGLVELLKSTGAPLTVSWQPGGHSLTEAELQAAKKWLELSGLLKE